MTSPCACVQGTAPSLGGGSSGAALSGPSGSNYERYWPLSASLLRSIAHRCHQLTVRRRIPVRPDRPALALRAADRIQDPPRRDPAEVTAVTYAIAQLGKPYVWEAPDGRLRLLGLTMAAWAKAGVSLFHSSNDQFYEGRAATIEQATSCWSPGQTALSPTAATSASTSVTASCCLLSTRGTGDRPDLGFLLRRGLSGIRQIA